MKNLVSTSVLLLFFAVSSLQSTGQTAFPQASPLAKISQRIGVTDVEIVYHRPSVKDRNVWGELIPYGQVWRAGANNNTTISFNSDVNINGVVLKEGVYGFHIIPEKEEWTFIFNKENKNWGSYQYKESEDAARIKVKPEMVQHQEQLTYGFDNLKENSGNLFISWEKIKASVNVEADTKAVLEARVSNDKTWKGSARYASYLINHKDFTEAGKWVEKSIAIEENFSNLSLKYTVLTTGDNKADESDKLFTKLLGMGKEDDLNRFGYTLLNAKKFDKALQVMEANVKANPESWNAYDSLAEVLEKKGDKKKAVKNYSKALELVTDESQKTRIQNTLKKLEG